MKSDNPGYHVNVIDKGVYGQFSKVVEEFQEVLDAWEQDSDIMAFVELSDMLGAMEAFYPDFDRHIEQATASLSHRLIHNDHVPAAAYDKQMIWEAFAFVARDHNPEWAVSNLLSHIMSYLLAFNLGIDDAMKMNHITKRAFINGRRISN